MSLLLYCTISPNATRKTAAGSNILKRGSTELIVAASGRLHKYAVRILQSPPSGDGTRTRRPIAFGGSSLRGRTANKYLLSDSDFGSNFGFIFVPMPDVVICDALRTPVGKHGGILKSIRPDDMAALVLRELAERNDLDPSLIDEVYLGCANQAGEDNRNIARMAVLLAGFPQSVPAVTVNRLCASGLEAATCAYRAILAGEGRCYLAGGVESMTRAPFSVPKIEKPFAFGNLTAYDTTLGWRYPNPRLAERFPLESMGETAENVAERWKISRELQDQFALESHQKAILAHEAGYFAEEILPVDIPAKTAKSHA